MRRTLKWIPPSHSTSAAMVRGSEQLVPRNTMAAAVPPSISTFSSSSDPAAAAAAASVPVAPISQELEDEGRSSRSPPLPSWPAGGRAGVTSFLPCLPLAYAPRRRGEGNASGTQARCCCFLPTATCLPFLPLVFLVRCCVSRWMCGAVPGVLKAIPVSLWRRACQSSVVCASPPVDVAAPAAGLVRLPTPGAPTTVPREPAGRAAVGMEQAKFRKRETVKQNTHEKNPWTFARVPDSIVQ